MGKGIRIGNLFGIKIRLDWSWLLIFLLISWNLTAVFGNMHPDWGVLLRGGVAVLAAVLFFGSVLVHELAHSLVAQAQGIQVRSITLFLFGGVADIQREPPSPKAEFLITIVGPIASIVLGLLFTILGGVLLSGADFSVAAPMALLDQAGPLTTIFLWLGPINLVLGIFNLIPGFPLDGGRLLRSALWAITDNLRRATRWASWVGQGIAWLMIAGGIAMIFGVTLPFFGGGFINGLWLAFIGWFLNSASIQSYRQVVIFDLLEDVPVTSIMRRDPPTVDGECTIQELVEKHLMNGDDQSFPVMEGGRFAGLVTLSDVREVGRDNWPTTLVRDVMTPTAELSSVRPDEEASEALHKLRLQGDVRQVPVMENGHLAGLVRRRDIMKWLQLQGDLS